MYNFFQLSFHDFSSSLPSPSADSCVQEIFSPHARLLDCGWFYIFIFIHATRISSCCCLYYWDVCWSLITHFSDHGHWYWFWFSSKSLISLWICMSSRVTNLFSRTDQTPVSWVKSFTFFFHLLSLSLHLLMCHFFSSLLVCRCRFSNLFSTCSL